MRFLLCIYPKGTGLEVWKIYNHASAEPGRPLMHFLPREGQALGQKDEAWRGRLLPL